MVEAVVFASAEPMTVAAIAARLPGGCDVGAALEALAERYAARGVRLVRAGEAWAFRTAADLSHLMAQEITVTRPLSRAAIETLAIVAYHQPATRAEIEAVRGVSVARGVVEQLLDLGWIGFGRRRDTPGRPATFVTTPAFLDHFGLRSTGDLPELAELRAAGLLGAERMEDGAG